MAQTEPAGPSPQPVVTLRAITFETVRSVCGLAVAPHQATFVTPNAISIAEAHFAPSAWFRAIYADDTLVGFVMLHDDPVAHEYHLWRFMIDARYQGRGLGRQALEAILAHVRTRPGATCLSLSCVPDPRGPGPFYERLGFAYTGAEMYGQLVMERALDH